MDFTRKNQLLFILATLATAPGLYSSQASNSSAPMASSYCAASSSSAPAQMSAAQTTAAAVVAASAANQANEENYLVAQLARDWAEVERRTSAQEQQASSSSSHIRPFGAIEAGADTQENAKRRKVAAEEAAEIEQKEAKASSAETEAWEAYVKKVEENDYAYEIGGPTKNEAIISDAELERRIDLYEHAAQKGNTNACCYLGKWYENKKDFQKAAQYYQAGARIGSVHCKFNLGQYYKNGKGVNKDLAMAFTLLKQVEGTEDLEPCCVAEELFSFYTQGIGGARQNLKKALGYFLLPAEKLYCGGHDALSLTAALMYEKGIMVPKDPAEAKEYFDYAVKSQLDELKEKHAGELATLSGETKEKRLQELRAHAQKNVRDEMNRDEEFFEPGVLLDCVGEKCALCPAATAIPFAKHDKISILSCWHPFCKDCLDAWERTHGHTCPTCLATGDSSAKGRVEGAVL